MKQLRCIAVDDEIMALEKLGAYIDKIPFLKLEALCESAFDAMEVMSGKEIDAVFIDINMPDMNGLDFISSMPSPPLVVFTTAYAEYAVESYRLSAVDYILKPFDFVTFQRAANKLLEHSARQECAMDDRDKALYVKDGYKYVNVKVSEIQYVAAMSEYIKLYISGHKPLTVHIPLKQVMESLPDYFLQIHRSYIVNMREVREIDRTCITMNNGEKIYVSESYKKVFNDYIRRNSLGGKL